MTLLPGRSDAPSRLNRPQNHIPVILPLEGYNFRQVTEEWKSKSKLRSTSIDYEHLCRVDSLFCPPISHVLLHLKWCAKKRAHPTVLFSHTLLNLTLFPISQADKRVVFVGLSARTVWANLLFDSWVPQRPQKSGVKKALLFMLAFLCQQK